MSKHKIAGGRTKKRGGKSGVVLPMPNRAGMESVLTGMFGGGDQSPLDQAQDIMFEAWDSPNPKRRFELATKALKISADCADAYVVLARGTARTEDAIDLYRKGVEAGERALGKRAFKEDVGHFWGLLETRPYMRARQGARSMLVGSGPA